MLACPAHAAVVLVRHCEPDPLIGNALSVVGQAQARQTAEALKMYHFDRIICTAHIRTYETAKIIRDTLGLTLDIETDDRFNQDIGDTTGWISAAHLLAMRDPQRQVLLVTHAPVLDALFTADKADASISYGAATEMSVVNGRFQYLVVKR